VVINIVDEFTIPLRQAAKLLPCRRQGKPAHVATLYRWAHRGLRGVRLETVQIGGTLCTSREALQRFFERLDRRPDPVSIATTPASRRRAAERAERELQRLGI
jgi:hypothetical protein